MRRPLAHRPRPHGAASCDLTFCRTILPQVSRTFALSIALLPKPLGDAVTISYLLCRILDTIEDDETLAAPTRAALFAHLDDALGDASRSLTDLEDAARTSALGGTGTDAKLCARAGSVVACFHALPAPQREAILPPVLAMSRGMRDFAQAIRPQTNPSDIPGLTDLDALEGYCYVVAGTVGELLDALFADDLARHGEARETHLKAEVRRPLAVSFGLGLQLVNILKDAGRDFAQGRCFLPQREAHEVGLDLAHLLDDDARPAARALVARLADRAMEHLDDATRYTLSWPADVSHIRLFCSVPLLLARATLDELLASDALLRPDRAPKISRLAVTRIVAAATAAASDDDALAKLLGLPDAAA